MSNFTKIVRLGTAETPEGRSYSIFCKVKYIDGGLSITGVEGPLRNGNCRGGCGQIVMSINVSEVKPAPGWDAAMLRRFVEVWNDWHMNDMRAGTPRQTAYLAGKFYVDFSDAVELLKQAGIYEDDGYRYGTAWLREDVPDDVLDWLKGLPDTDVEPAWV